MPIGWISTDFHVNIETLKSQANSIAESTVGSELRTWWLGWQGNWSGNLFDLAGIVNAFNRNEAADVYQQALTDHENGTTGDACSAKLQSDYLAAMEQAFRLENASPIRCTLLAASRRTGHADAKGVLGRVRRVAEDLIALGGTTP